MDDFFSRSGGGAPVPRKVLIKKGFNWFGMGGFFIPPPKKPPAPATGHNGRGMAAGGTAGTAKSAIFSFFSEKTGVLYEYQ